MDNLFKTGIRPLVDEYLLEKAKEKRDYGDYWSASSAGYCMRKNIFDRLQVPYVNEEDGRKQRVFESGHIFHEWMQRITKNAGLSIASEVELIDDKLMIKGHFDDLVLVDEHLILYDYKTQNSRAFNYKKPNMSHYHTMQLGTYLYMLRKPEIARDVLPPAPKSPELKEARILKISKDDLRMSEEQLLWSPALQKQVVEYWSTLNGYWQAKKLPKCTCGDYEINSKTGVGFMADPRYNPYYYDGEPCSLAWLKKCKEEGLVKW